MQFGVGCEATKSKDTQHNSLTQCVVIVLAIGYLWCCDLGFDCSPGRCAIAEIPCTRKISAVNAGS
eukprot:6053128-Amphidinium_carterae.1